MNIISRFGTFTIPPLYLIGGLLVIFLVILKLDFFNAFTSAQIPIQSRAQTQTQPQTQAQSPSILLFYTKWCPHCQQLMNATWPLFKQKYASKLNIMEIDGDQETDLVDQYQIRGFPTLILLNKGQRYDYSSSSRSLESLEQFVQSKVSASR